jgi:hypothetical protein
MTGFLVEIRVVPGTKFVRDELNIFEKKTCKFTPLLHKIPTCTVGMYTLV